MTTQSSRTTKNQDVSTGPLARPFAHSLAPLTRSLAPDCSLRSRPPLHSLVRSLAHFAHSLAHGKVYNLMSQFYLVLNHSAAWPGHPCRVNERYHPQGRWRVAARACVEESRREEFLRKGKEGGKRKRITFTTIQNTNLVTTMKLEH